MKLSKLEQIGRLLCRQYYQGILKPSNTYKPNDGLWLLARCVEAPLEDSEHRNVRGSSIWRQLLLGDLAKLPHMVRARVLGGRASLDEELEKDEAEELRSIDGGYLSTVEVSLYSVVGQNFIKLMTSSGKCRNKKRK